MCSKKAVKKVFGGGSSSHSSAAANAPTPAVTVAAPASTSNEGMTEINNGDTNAQAKGKRKLTISRVNSIGTGVNL